MYRRNLPHWHPPRAAVFLTWRLAGSLPAAKLLKREMVAQASACGSWGPDWLRRPEVAKLVVNEFHRGHDKRYQLHAFVVMPNHIHLLLSPWIELANITRTIKGRSAREANAILGRIGVPFWQDESFDHWIRHPTQFEKARIYIENNPVRAGLVQRPEEWPFSSAEESQAKACATIVPLLKR